MKLSCIPVSFFTEIINGDMSIKDWASLGADVGLDGIDLSILFIKKRDPGYINSLRKEIQNAGLMVAMVAAYPDFTHPDPIQREREINQCCEDIIIAARLGAELFRVTAGQAYPMTGREQGIAWAIAGLTEVLEAAEKYGVRLVFENHTKPEVWEYIDFSHPTDIFLSIVEATASTTLGVNWDTANTLAYGDDPLPILGKVLDRVVSVHAADTSVRRELKHVALGMGIVPFREMFSMLKNYGFDGWICMEEASFQGKAGLRAAAEFIRMIWEEV